MKTYLLLFLSLFSFYAYAEDNLAQQKVKLLQNFYQQYLIPDEELAKVKKQYKPSKFFTKEYLKITNTGDEMECADFDPYIQGQDYEHEIIKKTISYQPQKNGRVKVAFKNFQNDVSLYYQFHCQDNKCLISDLITLFPDKEQSHSQAIKECIEDTIKNRK